MNKIFIATLCVASTLAGESFASKRQRDPADQAEGSQKKRCEGVSSAQGHAFTSKEIRDILVEKSEKSYANHIFRDNLVESLYEQYSQYKLYDLPVDALEEEFSLHKRRRLLPEDFSESDILIYKYDYILHRNQQRYSQPYFIAEETVKYLHEDAQKGSEMAQNALGFLYQKGWKHAGGASQAPDMDQALKWYMRAAAQEHGEAQCEIAHLYKSGWTRTDGTLQAPDTDQALEWYTRAAAQKHAEAQYEIARLYESGWTRACGAPQAPDMDRAVAWYTKASQDESAFAQYELACLYENGWTRTDGTSQAPDMDQAVVWYTKSAQGGMEIQHELACLYEEGWTRADGTRQAPDVTQAVAWYIKAAKQTDNEYAKNRLGNLYQSGWERADGIRQAPDLDRAVRWYIEAAQDCIEDAQYELGGLYARGWTRTNGMPRERDMDKAISYFAKAAKRQHEGARTALVTYLSITKTENSAALSGFALSEDVIKKKQDALVQMSYLVGLSKPESMFKDSAPNRPLHECLKVAEQDMRLFDDLLPFLNQSGFLMTNVSPIFKFWDTTFEGQYVDHFSVLGRNYFCVGRDNVRAARQLLPLLDRMQDHPILAGCLYGFEISKAYVDPEDQESLENANSMIGALTTMRATFKALSHEVYQGIQTHAPLRNKAFEDQIGL